MKEMQVEIKSWDELRSELEYTYTMSVRDACQILKCERTWVQRYIRPHVHYIYVSNGHGKRKIPYLSLIMQELGKESRESVWLNTKEFENLIRSSITKSTRQTIEVPVEWLINADVLERFEIEYDKLQKEKEESSDIKKLYELQVAQDELLKTCANKIGKVVLKNLPKYNKRGAVEHIACEVPNFELEELKAVHDLKSYGDTSEGIYRDLFNVGACKLTLQIPDADGVISDKIYYLTKKAELETIKPILISYADYKKFFDA